MTLDTRLDAAIHWAHPRLEFHISVWFQGCEQWADLLSEVLWSRHKEGRRAKTTLLQDKDTSGGGGMVSLWLCLCVFVCVSVCLYFVFVSFSMCLHLSVSAISVPDERWIAWMWMTTDQRKGEIIILRKGRHLLSLLLFIIIIYYYYLLLLFLGRATGPHSCEGRFLLRRQQVRKEIVIFQFSINGKKCIFEYRVWWFNTHL